MKKNCLVIGDLNIDLIFSSLERKPVFGSEILSKEWFLDIGGSGGIFSAVLSKLGINTCIVSKIGSDYLGDFLVKKLKVLKVNTDFVIIDEKRNTGITVNLSYPKDKYQISSLDILISLREGEINIRGIDNLDHVHFSSYFMMSGLHNKYLEVISNIRSQFKSVTFSLDTNDDPNNIWDGGLIDVINSMDILFLNENEALNITGMSNTKNALEKLAGYLEVVIIKLGKKGYMAKIPEGYYTEKSLDVNFRDSTGAGDNFDAGFIYGFLSGLSDEISLKIANLCGAKSVEYLGGVGNEKKFIELKESVKELLN